MSVIAEIGSAFISIVPSAVGFNRKLESDVGGGISGSGKKLGGVFGKAFILGGSVLAAAGIGTFLKDSIVEAREAQKVGALTANVIKTTGGAAKISAAQVGTLAMSISNKTAIDDEAIQSGANLLLTFNKVANAGKGQAAIFDRATAAAVDLSASGFGDINGASKQLGKALQDPIKGISALSRSGVAFTAEQQATIKSMVGANNVLGAQKIILAEVETQVKGSAAAQATAGEKATVAFGNLKEQIGTALLPVIDRLATTFSTKIVPAISGFVTGIQTGAGAGGAFASVVKTIANNFGTIAPVLGVVVAGLAAYKLASTAVAVASAIQAAGTIAATGATFSLNAALRANPIGLVITGLTLLGVGLVIAYKKSATFRAIVNGAFAAVKAVVSSVVGFLSKYVPQAFSILVAGVKTYIAIYRAVVVGAFNVVRGTVQAVGSFVAGAVRFFASFAGGVKGRVVDAGQAVASFATKVGEKVGDVVRFFTQLPGKIAGALASLPGQMLAIGGNIVSGLVSGITGAAGRVTAAVNALVSKIPQKIRSIMGIASPSKVTAILGGYIGDGLAKGLLKSEKKVTRSMEKILTAAKDKIAQRIDDFKALAGSVGDSFASNLFSATATDAVLNDAGATITPAMTAGQNFLATLTSTRGNLSNLIGDFNTLRGFGLPGSFLAKLFADGGYPLIHELATNRDQATAATGLFGEIESLSSSLGNAVAQYAPDIGGGYNLGDLLAAQMETNQLLAEMPEKTGKATGGAVNGGAAQGQRNRRNKKGGR